MADQQDGWNVAAKGQANGAVLEDSFSRGQGFALTMAEVELHKNNGVKKQMLASGVNWQVHRSFGWASQSVKRQFCGSK